jgi:adenylate cyclase
LIGSKKRREYTVLGNTVNEGARFEPANKVYGTSIIIGEKTFIAAHNYIEARLLDRTLLKGKSEPIKFYELIATKGKISQEMDFVRKHYEAGLQYAWNENWTDAMVSFEAALGVKPDDGPSLRYIDIVRKKLERTQMDGPLTPVSTTEPANFRA